MSRPAGPACLDVDLEAWQPAVQHRPRQVNGRARQCRAQQAAAGRMGIPLDPHVLALHRIAYAGNRPVDGQVQIMAVRASAVIMPPPVTSTPRNASMPRPP